MRTHLDIFNLLAYILGMRTTLTIDDDLLAAAKSLARARSETLGEAVSELIRRGLNTPPRTSPRRRKGAFPTFSVPKGAHPITLEDVRSAEDEA